MKPGATARPFASMTDFAFRGAVEIVAIFPARMPTLRMASRPDSGSITRPLRMARSYASSAATRGLGTQQRGAGGKSQPLVHLVHGHQANLAKLFIGEESLFLVAGTLGVAKPGFVGDSGELVLWNSQQHSGSALRHVFGN